MAQHLVRSVVCASVVGAIAGQGCHGQAGKSTPRPIATTQVAKGDAIAVSVASPGSTRLQVAFDESVDDGALALRLPDTRPTGAGAVIAPMSASDTQALLARLEPLPAVGDPSAAPAIRPPSAPPPRTGGVQPIAFEAVRGSAVADAPIAPAAAAKPLAIPQILPEGEVRAESEIRVRFDEPMVPVAQVNAAVTPPIKVVPAVAGTWRWIDTRVIAFTATPRLPQATSFTVTVAAGIRAVSGATLPADAQSGFRTPPLALTGLYPTATVRPDSPIVVRFDQDFEPSRVVPMLRAKVRGKPVGFHAISLDDARPLWRKNPNIEADPKQHQLGDHYVVLAPDTAWPADSSVTIELAKAAPSREGPRVSEREDAKAFAVAAPFTVRGIECDGTEHARMTGARCAAAVYLRVAFSNPIAPASFHASDVQIEGEPFEDHDSMGGQRNVVGVRAPTPVGHTYAIAITGALVDVFGQPLVGARRPTFTTTPYRYYPHLWATTGLHVLDPRFEIPQWVVTAQAVTAIRLQLYAVQPKDYFAYEAYEQGQRSAPPGRRVLDKRYDVGANYAGTLRADLRQALDASGVGHVIAIATADPAPGALENRERMKALAWIQVSKLGVTARTDGDRVSAWVTDIAPAHFLEPKPGATTGLVIDGRPALPTATTDADGHALVDLVAPGDPRKPRPGALLVASSGADSAFTAIEGYERAMRERDALWYVADDRFTYKPGEKVYLKGWVRWTNSGTNPDIALPDSSDAVGWSLADSRGNKIASGNAPFTDQGGFDLEVELPKNVNLGAGTFTLTTKTSAHRHPIEILEFRTPSYAVDLDDDVTHSGATPLVAGEAIEMATTAHYYAGGGLPGAAIAWDAKLTTASYSPPGWSDYSFEPQRARGERYERRWLRVEARQTGTLSGASSAGITIGITALPAHRPSVLTVDATVSDIDRAHIRASSHSIVVHPSSLYVGLRDREAGIEAIVTDVEGNVVAGVPVHVDIEGFIGSERYRNDAKPVDTQTCDLTSGTAPIMCTWKRRDWKTWYTAVAHVRDARGRTNAAQIAIPWISSDSDAPTLAIVPDRTSYRPGDIAKLEIKSSVVPATAIVSFARQGVIAQKRVELVKASTTIELPIEAAYIENIYVQVDRVAKRQHQEADHPQPLPEHVSAEVNLRVDLEGARLAMKARPLKPLVGPGEQATFEVEVRHAGKPMQNAEVALMVVDEAVLALSHGTYEDPLPVFYKSVMAGTSELSTLGIVHDAGHQLDGGPGFEKFELTGGEGWGTIGTGQYGTVGHGSGSGSGYGYGGGTAVVVSRKDFRANAAFSPRLHTDGNGKVRLTVKMPDNLTRFRIVALATAEKYDFGKAESSIVVQRKLNARAVAPRFLNQGDRFSLPVVVQNLDSSPRTVDVAVRAANLASIGEMGKRVTVPPGQRAELRFELATKVRGKATIQTIAVSGDFADASTVEVPVWEPATTESFATYGTVDDATKFERLAVPASIFPDVGGVEVELASTQMQSLTDAYWYLYAYPHECAEQRSARMLATSSMYDVLEAFQTPDRPDRKTIQATAQNDLAILSRDQLGDGGWGYFRGMKSDPYVTMQVLTAIARHDKKGRVVAAAVANVTKQADKLTADLAKLAATPKPRKDAAYTVSLAAAAVSALAAAGVDARPRAERIHALAIALETYPMDAKARLLAIVAKSPRDTAMRQSLVKDIVSATHETAAGATVTASYEPAERMLLVSQTKTTALALDALIREAPEQPLIAKLARGVLDSRHRGRWVSTQENLVVLAAMRRYFDTYEKTAPNYVGKAWLGTGAYAEQAFSGRTGTRATTHLPWTALAPGSTHDLALVKDGAGRMYYRVGITYAPKQRDLPALDAGFVVRRSYSAIDDPGDVVKTKDGYKIRLGARVLVTVETSNTTRRYGVAVVDPRPAGLEAVDENLAISERAAAVTETSRWDFRDERDDRSEAFAMELAEGSHRLAYTARATTPGTFIAAPAKAEEMYAPETFGRSTGAVVVIE